MEEGDEEGQTIWFVDGTKQPHAYVLDGTQNTLRGI